MRSISNQVNLYILILGMVIAAHDSNGQILDNLKNNIEDSDVEITKSKVVNPILKEQVKLVKTNGDTILGDLQGFSSGMFGKAPTVNVKNDFNEVIEQDIEQIYRMLIPVNEDIRRKFKKKYGAMDRYYAQYIMRLLDQPYIYYDKVYKKEDGDGELLMRLNPNFDNYYRLYEKEDMMSEEFPLKIFFVRGVKNWWME